MPGVRPSFWRARWGSGAPRGGSRAWDSPRYREVGHTKGEGAPCLESQRYREGGHKKRPGGSRAGVPTQADAITAKRGRGPGAGVPVDPLFVERGDIVILTGEKQPSKNKCFNENNHPGLF
jgi:hypothetical protein